MLCKTAYKTDEIEKDSQLITNDDLTAACTTWGEGLVSTAEAYEAGGIDSARKIALELLEDVYGFNLGPVMFKPTLSGGEQTFRTTRDGALSYFIAHDPNYPHDHGFALKGWRDVRFETAAQFIEGDVAMWMGWVFCTDKDGNTTKVDKSFGCKKDEDGIVRIILHHSSLPYEP